MTWTAFAILAMFIIKCAYPDFETIELTKTSLRSILWWFIVNIGSANGSMDYNKMVEPCNEV